jgi:A/G-specific adenine glycosylase
MSSNRIKQLPPGMTPARARRLAAGLLAWYESAGRCFPWRAPTGTQPDPYRVWLAEIMLQQTTTVTMTPYFEAFFKRWPNLEALAAASLDDVLHAWAGLGYYARARNLHTCARRLVAEYGGRFPDDETGLRALPGIGAYSAAAIAAIAFARSTTVIDGNVTRVLIRLVGLERPAGEVAGEVRTLAQCLTPARRPGEYAQAIMDLGATICTPSRPDCPNCPWRRACKANAKGIAAELPRKVAKRARPLRHAVAFWAARSDDGRVLLRRRPEEGLLGGMMELPSTEWADAPLRLAAARRNAPLKARWRRVPGTVRHGFSHFDIEFVLLAGTVSEADDVDGVWVAPERLGEHALPSLTRKLIRHARA